MLQQTQTSRVSEKFMEFIKKFPDFKALAKAPLEAVLKVWQGLGYNRRAIALKNIAEIIVSNYNEKLPNDLETLKSFPQIGNNTASSILAFAFNIPTYFIETNIRRVYIHFFFQDKKIVYDKDILKIAKKT
ncbi:MAG: A/G-specific adenine glycosylase, partial [Promethearchaeota archaeon]